MADTTSRSSRQMVRDALSFREGPIPADFGSTGVTGIHVSVVEELRHHYGLEQRPVKVCEPYQMLGLVEDDLRRAMGADAENVFGRKTLFGFPLDDWKEFVTPWGQTVLVPGDFNVSKGDGGDLFIYPQGDTAVPPSARMPEGGYFFDSLNRQKPDFEEGLTADDNLEEFSPVEDDDLDYFAREVERAGATGRAVVAAFGGTGIGDIALVPGPWLKNPRGIRDVTEWYVSTLTRQELLHEIFSRQVEIAIENMKRINDRIGPGKVDVAYVCGTDFGTQTSSFCSVDTFRELYAPYYKRMNTWIHDHTDWKTFKHSCGAVREFIPEFIDCGFDVLNPLQLSATGMDPVEIKAEFGKDLVFWGGGVDTQKTLPFGTPDEVRDQVRSRCDVLGRGGGFVFNTIHNIQAKTPITNVVAMLEAVAEFR